MRRRCGDADLEAVGEAILSPDATALLEAVPYPALVLDHRLTAVAANSSFARAFAPPVFNRSFAGLLALDASETGRLTDRLARVFAVPDAVSRLEVTSLRTPDRPVRLALVARALGGVHDDGYALVGITAVDRDSQSDAAMQQLLECVPDATVVVDEEGRIVAANSQVESLFGYDSRELVGASVETLVPEDVRAEHGRRRDCYHRDARPRPMGAAGGLHGRRKDGSRFAVEIGLTPLEIDGRRMIVAAVRNASDDERLQDSLRAQADALSRSNAELELFASFASHDLQEPLRAVFGFSRLLENRYRGRLDPDADHLLGQIAAGTARMQALIDDLLAYARVGRGEASLGPVSCGEVVDEVIDDLRTAIATTGCKVRREPLPVVRGDRRALKQLFRNLLGNAIKFRSSRPLQIRISARPSGGQWWSFEVTDNGVGVDPKFKGRIFEMFERLHTRDEYEGTGIGLAICKRIVERHGGSIEVESEEGLGACFRFTLPMPRSTDE